MSTSVDPILGALRFQAAACAFLGSPFTGALLNLVVEDVERDGPTMVFMAPWIGQTEAALTAAAMPLRLAGAFHDLALSGDEPDLSAAYPAPGREVDPAQTWAAVLSAIPRHRERLLAFMDHPPQTNEVRRSACLVPGFLFIAQETGLPIRSFEIGASAGLNLNWDRYAYRFGETPWGDQASPVFIDTDWSGAPPPVEARVRVVERAASDLRPVDLTDPLLRRRLLAYVWPDQFERLARLRAAIDLALALEVKVEAAGAVDWTRAKVAPQAGAVSVLYHSVFWQYMPPPMQAELADIITAIGGRATEDAPFVWLRMEPAADGSHNGMEVRRTFWPGGEELLLAIVHPHGAAVAWKA